MNFLLFKGSIKKNIISIFKKLKFFRYLKAKKITFNKQKQPGLVSTGVFFDRNSLFPKKLVKLNEINRSSSIQLTPFYFTMNSWCKENEYNMYNSLSLRKSSANAVLGRKFLEHQSLNKRINTKTDEKEKISDFPQFSISKIFIPKKL